MATVVGGTGSQTLTGNDAENDSIWGAGGTDILYGGAGTGGGNDYLDGGTGSDTIYGGDGNDTLVGGSGGGSDLLYGGAGIDTADFSRHLTGLSSVNGGSANFDLNNTAVNVNLATGIATGLGTDTLYGIENVIGGGGADVITGDGNANSLSGGAGDDTIDGGGGSDTIEGGLGNDSLVGGAGTDLASYANSATAVNASLLAGTSTGEGTDTLSGFENLTGSAQGDTLTGDGNANVIDGGGGSDRIYGGAGADTLYGGSGTGSDTLYGGTGNDSIDGGAGTDLVYGGSGADSIAGGSEVDTVFGGVGNDTIDGGTGGDLIYGGPDTGTTGSGGNVAEQFNWTDYSDEQNLAGGVVQDTGNINVTVTYNGGFAGSTFTAETTGNATGDEREREIYVDGGEPFNRDSSAELFRPADGGGTTSSTAQFDFAAESGSGYANEVSNLRFRISDIDLSGFTDQVTVRAFDAEGNEIPITITVGDPTYLSLTGNTVTAINTAVNPNDLQGSVLYQVAGPVARIIVTYTDLNNAQQAIRISDLHFEAVPLVDNDSLIGGDGDDTIYGGIGLDTLLGGVGNDRLYGGLGNDSIEGGDNADLIYGDDGNDTINFGSGNDTVFGGAGNDVIDDIAGSPLSGQNLIYGGTGDDTVWTGNDADVLYGDEGNDLLQGEAGNDTLYGGADNDNLFGGGDSDQAFGGTGNDNVSGDAGTDTLYGDAGSDSLYGGTENDQLFGGSENDLLYGGGNEDRLFGGTGTDRLYGDAGNDILYGGAGLDTMFGGIGNDVFYIGLNDVLGNAEVIDGGGSGNSTLDLLTDNDVIDLQPYGWSRVTINYTGGNPLSESGTILIYSSPIKIPANLIGVINFTEIETIIPCFTAGTRILTDRGDVAVEALVAGDLVMTRDRGLLPLRWVGRRHLGLAELIADPDLQPVRIGRGAFGAEGPLRTMLVSPQHRVLIEGARAEMYFGEEEVLVPAKHLVGRAEVTRALPQAGVTYIHILFDQHEIVLSDGLWTESFQPALRTLNSLDIAARREVLELFPELATGEKVFAGARLSLKAHEAKVLVSD